MMRIYADRALLSGAGPPLLMLQPFWGREPEFAGMPTAGRFTRFFEESPAFVQFVEPSGADVHVFPNMYEQVSGDPATLGRLASFVSGATREGKPAAVFCCSDSDEPIPCDGPVEPLPARVPNARRA